jgi:protein KRI1
MWDLITYIYQTDACPQAAGMPTRFKYTTVQSQSFALSPVEILLATDAELNQYMGLKKYAPYRKDGSNWDKNRATRLKEFKQKVKERSVAFGAGEDLSKVLPEKPAKKRKGKKERMKAKTAATDVDLAEAVEEKKDDAELPATSSKKRKVADEKAVDEQAVAPEAAPTGELSKRKRRRHKKSVQET